MGNESQGYYDAFSAAYEDPRGGGYHALIDELEVESVAELVRGRDVLEAGCGTGLILERLAHHASTVRGFDLSPGMLARARARGLDVTLGDVTAVPFADESFDVVCSFKVLAHVSEIGRALSELARVTRPGGQLVLEFYNPWSLRYLAKRLAGPQPIAPGKTEADVYTRWDPPTRIAEMLPPGLTLKDFRGVRVVTPAAFVHEVPVLGPVIAGLERRCLRSPLRHLGGFLLALVEKAA